MCRRPAGGILPEDTDLRACAFDEMASTYDATFTDTVIGRALREIVWSRFLPVFQSSRQILELGCGTGEDAVQLARSGFRVIATDPSSRMIQVARGKAQGCQCEADIEFHCLDMEQLGPGLDGRIFDGVLSNFGAVNCARGLPALIADIAGRLRPGAPLLWVIMGRRVPWEWLWYLAHGNWSKAWRRLHTGGVQWQGMTISYPTPAQLTSYLRPYFAIDRVAPLGVALPPSYAAAWLERSPRALVALTRLERLAQRSSAFASWSDHYIVEATRLASGSVE
jgi:ubiquinone/menaquinone biosynthesis C-methylase UbiE